MTDAKQPTYPVATIAKLLLLSERRVYQLVNDGIIPRHERGRFEIASAVQGYIRFLQERQIGGNASPTDYQAEKARLTKLQADYKEIELAELKGSLMPMELVLEAWQGHIANARAKLLGLPPKAAAQAEGAEGYAEIEQLFKDLINEALDELANDGLPKQYSRSIESIAANLESAADADG